MQHADFADLDAFTAVARARGFRAAAALRNVSASSLSEAVRRLEARLGVRLAESHHPQRHPYRSRPEAA
ncbi:LysR family transcriptional regulator [Caulobacter segnis]